MKKKTLWIIIIIIAIAIAAYFITTSITGKATSWSWSYCDEVNPCSAGIGDCDSNADCQTGYCAENAGVKYGQTPSIDVCEVKPGA